MVQQVDKSEQRIRQMFADIAPRYDLMNHVLSLNIDRWWRNQTVKRLRLDGRLPVLDACTGTGDLAIALARRLAGQAKVVGTDFCEEMLTIARHKQHRLSLDENALVFKQADTQDLPFEADTFQAVTVAFGIRNVTNTDAGIREMTRVCATGGQVAILEFSQPSMFGLRQVYSAYFKYLLPRIGQSLSKNEAQAYQYLPDSVLQFPSGRALADRMASLGLHDVRFFPYSFGVATLYLGVK